MATNWINANGGDWNTAGNWDGGLPSPTNAAAINSDVLSANGKSITLSALAQCMGLTITGSKTFSISSAVYSIEFYGDYVGSTVCTWAFTGTAYSYSKGNMSIATNGQTLNWNRWYIDTVGGAVTLGDNCNLGATTINLSNGTLNTADKNITVSTINTVPGTKTLILGASLLNVSRFIIDYPTGFTFNCGTSTIIQNGNTFGGGNFSTTYYNVVINYYGTATINGSNTFNNLSLIGGSAISDGINMAGNQVVSGVLTITGANRTSQRVLIQSSTIGTPRTITCNGTVTPSNCDFQDITLAGTANRDFSAQTDIGNCGGNSGIIFPPAIDCYIKHTSGAMSVSNVAKWVTTDGGSTQARVPLPQDRAWGVASSFTGASTVTMDCPRIGSIDLSGVNQAVTFDSGAMNFSSFGHFVLGNNITQVGTGYFSCKGRGPYNLNTYGKTVNYIEWDLYLGTYTILSNITQTGQFGFRNQTAILDFNNFNLTARYFSSVSTTYLRNSTLLINNGQVDISGIIYPETSTLIFSGSSGSANYIIALGGKTYNNIQFSNSGTFTGTFDISGSNTFNQITIDPGCRVRFTAGTTQTILTPLIANGAGNPITLSGVTAAEYTLSLAQDSDCDFLTLSNCKATGAGTFFAGDNSVDGGGNTNVIFGREFHPQIIGL